MESGCSVLPVVLCGLAGFASWGKLFNLYEGCGCLLIRPGPIFGTEAGWSNEDCTQIYPWCLPASPKT